MNAVFHWLPEKSAPLRAIRRALKPGGRFGLTTVTAERAGSWLHVIRQRVLARDPYNKYPEAQAMAEAVAFSPVSSSRCCWKMASRSQSSKRA